LQDAATFVGVHFGVGLGKDAELVVLEGIETGVLGNFAHFLLLLVDGVLFLDDDFFLLGETGFFGGNFGGGAGEVDQIGGNFFPFAALGAVEFDAVAFAFPFADEVEGTVFEIKAGNVGESGDGQEEQREKDAHAFIVEPCFNGVIPMKVGVVVFPGSNCDHDAWYAFNQNAGVPAEYVWHDETSLSGFDAIVLPGGFSYGDYLRCGAIARFSPVMGAVKKFAASGGPVLGICNGFQILVESGLLPGALIRNAGLKFVCRDVRLRVETSGSPFTAALEKGDVLRMPVAHGEGLYYADEQTLDRLEAEDRVALRYVDNPNGSLRDIAGILNEGRNVMGMMPHPERACDPLMGSTDGLGLLTSLVGQLA